MSGFLRVHHGTSDQHPTVDTVLAHPCYDHQQVHHVRRPASRVPFQVARPDDCLSSFMAIATYIIPIDLDCGSWHHQHLQRKDAGKSDPRLSRYVAVLIRTVRVFQNSDAIPMKVPFVGPGGIGEASSMVSRAFYTFFFRNLVDFAATSHSSWFSSQTCRYHVCQTSSHEQ